MPMSRRTWIGAAAAALACGAVCAQPHSYSTPRIAGRTWTPDRDGDGDGKVRGENWRNLPLFTWLLVGKAVMNDVIETPHYLGPLGYDGAESIMTNWSGAAYDPVNKRMYINGGGHNGSDECETGIYLWDIPSCTFSRTQNRCDRSLRNVWDDQKNRFTSVSLGRPRSAPTLPDGGLFDGAGPYGRGGAVHSGYSLIHLTPAFMGNSNGGIWMGMSVYNLDTHKYDTPYWWNTLPEHLWTHGQAEQAHSFFDDNSVYQLHEQNYVSQFNLTEKQTTDWSAVVGRVSDQKCYRRKHSHTTKWSSYNDATFCIMETLRQCVSFSSLGHVRIRYGQARDSGAASWSAYTDTITLTSSDGSHTDLAPANFVSGNYSKLSLCGACYDAALDCIWLQPNNVGDELYRIDGISTGNKWITIRIAGTGALKRMTNGTYGRMRLATMAGKKILVRLNSIFDPVQVMRIS